MSQGIQPSLHESERGSVSGRRESTAEHQVIEKILKKINDTLRVLLMITFYRTNNNITTPSPLSGKR